MEKRQLIEEIKLQDFFLLVSFRALRTRTRGAPNAMARRGAHAQKKDKAGDGGRGRERAEDQRDARARASWLVTSSRAGEWIAPSPTP